MTETFFELAAVTCLALAAYLAVALVLDWWAPYIERRGRNNARFEERLYRVKYGHTPCDFPPLIETTWGVPL